MSAREVDIKVPVTFQPEASPKLITANAAHLSVYFDTGRGYYANAWPIEKYDGGFRTILMDPKNISVRLTGVERFSAKRLAGLEARLRANAETLASSLAAGTLTPDGLRGAL